MNSFEDDDDVSKLANDAHWLKYIGVIMNEDAVKRLAVKRLHVDRSQQRLADNALTRIMHHLFKAVTK